MHSVIETPDFAADAKEAGISEGEKINIITELGNNPQTGDLIPGTGGARKVRFGGRGKGKSGGYRVITFYAGTDVPLFLLNVFSKGDRIDLSQVERNKLRKELAGLAEDYRDGVRRHVKSGKPHPPERSPRAGIRSR
jgi:hypothetical protein